MLKLLSSYDNRLRAHPVPFLSNALAVTCPTTAVTTFTWLLRRCLSTYNWFILVKK